jgi:hypothetical protein
LSSPEVILNEFFSTTAIRRLWLQLPEHHIILPSNHPGRSWYVLPAQASILIG